MRFSKYFVFLTVLFILSCSKKEVNKCSDTVIRDISSLIIGDYEEYVHHLEAIDLGNQLCLIAGGAIKYFPYNITEPPHFIFDQFNFNGIEINSFDTIVQRSNSFYRFFPSTKQFVHLYTPPFTIHNFRVNPKHGIGFFWGNVFVEPVKFNYFNFNTNLNETIFQYSEFVPDSIGPVYQYQIYLENNIPYLFMRTGNNSNFLATTGVFYNIRIDELEILKRKEYSDKGGLNIFDFNDFHHLLATYGSNENLVISNYEWETDSDIDSYRFPIDFLKTRYDVSTENLSLIYHSLSDNNKLEYINWRSGSIEFMLPLPEDYRTAFVETKHLKDKYVILYQRRGNVALIYDVDGCIIKTLNARSNIEQILVYNESRIIIMNDLNQIELFQMN